MGRVPLLVVSMPWGLAGPQQYLQSVLDHPGFQRAFDAECWWTEDVYRGLQGKWRLWQDARARLRRRPPRAVYIVADLSLAFWLGLVFRLAGAPPLVFHSQNSVYGSPRRPIVQWLFRAALRRWARERLALGSESAVAMFGTAEGMVQVPCLIDFNALRASVDATPASRTAGSPLRVGCVGRLSEQKNQALLLRALAALGPDAGLELWLVGEGGDRAALEALALKLGLAERVRFLGPRTDMARVYVDLDAVAVPSVWEGQCRVVAEAQAFGLPVLISPAIPDFACLPSPPVRRVPGYAVADWAQALGELAAVPPPRVLPTLAAINAELVALESGVLRLGEALRRAAA
ncbi:MAG: glycosyltransferase [Xanthomonadales bacterium]|jgi:glycosyltransferase involved in cell wall biosynthesis|nr:glycosyltransferase [Xanthomonadales bacterium]